MDRETRAGRLTLWSFRRGNPSRRKKGGRCQWMLHIRTCSRCYFSLLPLSVCVIRFSRERNKPPLLRIVDGWCWKTFSLNYSEVSRLRFPFLLTIYHIKLHGFKFFIEIVWILNKIQSQNQKTELQTEHFSSFLDCPEDGEKKLSAPNW